MKKFIAKTTIICTVPLIISILSIGLYRYKVHNIQVDSEVSILIVGDSHTQTGIDDSIVNNSLNISKSSEHLLYTYNKVKLLLNNNSNIHKLVLGVSFHTFVTAYDKYLYEFEKTKVMFPNYYPILDIESIKDLNAIPWIQYNTILKTIVKPLLYNLSIQEYLFIGSYYKSERSVLNDGVINGAIQRHYFSEYGIEMDYSECQIKYLNKIVALCNSKNVEVIIVNMPVYVKYYEKIPSKFIAKYYSLIKQLNSRVKFYDFCAFKMDEKCFGDGDHLNSNGAKIISEIINERIVDEAKVADNKLY